MQLHKKYIAEQRAVQLKMIRPLGRVLSKTKVAPAKSKGSLYEFQKLPYNPAIPRKRKSTLESIWTTFKRLFFFGQFLVKSIPVWIQLIWEWLNPPPPKNIAGWNALVTGGSNGIGRAVSLELAKIGCNVVIVDIDAENGEKVVQELLKYRVKAAVYKADIAYYEVVVDLKSKIEQDFGHVDLLINNAGTLPFLVPDEYSPENIRRMMEVNLLSHFWTIDVFLPGMYRRSKGHIVALSSQTAYTPTGFARSYATGKYAVRGFMEDLHDEIYHAGFEDKVVTTTVFPVPINTRKEFVDFMLRLPGFENSMLNSVEYVGKTIVQGILSNQRKLFIPNFVKTWQLALFEDLPREISRLLVKELLVK
nr:estradiol 17-beta-dehydrogenase 11-like [Aedes albopictus]